MKFKSPMKVTWIIAVILGALGTLPVLGVDLLLLSANIQRNFPDCAAWVLLALGTVIKGL